MSSKHHKRESAGDFGGDGIIADNNPEQQEKSIKYEDLVANAVIFQNVVDLTVVIGARYIAIHKAKKALSFLI
ncbi:transposase [Bacillus wiedmannii]|uniref:transposase n=1 Tax=Bacillus wiedmannii TaxID=1890302 RepID=UPI001D0DE2B4|nr:transposase [Bacillus wiedmannii]